MVKNIIKIILLSFATLIFVGCVAANVTVFGSLPKANKNNLYSFEYFKGQKNNLEYAFYKKKIKLWLKKYNFIESQKSNFVVKFKYGIDKGTQKIASRPVIRQATPIVVRDKIDFHNNKYNSYSNSVIFSTNLDTKENSIYSYTDYEKYLTLFIYKKVDNKLIYQAKVSNISTSKHLNEIIDQMLKALFKEFPGVDGTTKRITIY